MSKAKTGLGLIGTGQIGRIHLVGITALRDAGLVNVDIHALCDIDEESLKSAAELFEPAQTYQDYNDLINDENVNVVYVCTPTSKHTDIVKAAAKAKKDVFCEKPLAHSCPQAREMFAVTKDAGVKAGVGLVLRYDPFFLYAMNLITTRDFGYPILAHVRVDQHFPIDHGYYTQWRGNHSIAGGGTLIEHSIHDIDILQWFFGDIVSVYAKIGFFSDREVEDQASLILTHKDGAVSTLDSLWHTLDRPNERRIEFFFEKGYIGITLEAGKRWLEFQTMDEAPVRVHAEDANNSLLEALGVRAKNIAPEAYDALVTVGTERFSALSYAFIKAVQSDSDPSPSFLDAIAAHRIVDAAYESSNKTRTVEIL
ncbi:MAG: Gfo/Idh/MocA family protein [Candidatus Thorarchaeota archaeon]